LNKQRQKKEIPNSQWSKMDKECEQLNKEAVKALREWKRTKINRNSLGRSEGEGKYRE
jgi:hypothetical protein